MKEVELNHMRLYAALLLAQAVQRQYAGAKLGLAVITEQGFYYDLDVPGKLSDSDLAGIEDEMRRIAAENASSSIELLPLEEALRLFESRNEPWKSEWIRESAGDKVAVMRSAAFLDVVPNEWAASSASHELPAFKLLNTAGA